MREKRWKLRQDYDLEAVEKLAKEIEVDKIIATLLVERGITTFEQARCFFRPGLEQIHDPFLMKDMDKAIRRINDAIRYRERILVYGDYDVDGTSAVALVYSYFKGLHDNIDFYIPDRELEGYGISFKGIDYAHDTGVALIIALDCGIKAIEQVDYAKKFGIDVIIGDHHLPGEELPQAVAVLDAKREDCPYPFKELSGCGVGFKIVEAYIEEKIGVRLCDPPDKLNDDQRNRRNELQHRMLPMLDLVTISIASDIVPLVGENRVLAYFGLKVINTKPRPGIEAILQSANVELRGSGRNGSGESKGYFSKELTLNDLVFLVGPRINAAGRIRSAFDSVRVLICEDREEASQLAHDIDEYNTQRKDLDTSATNTAKERIDGDPALLARKSIIIYDDKWHRGVVGIVASRLMETYYKPTIVFTKSAEGLLTGSARSIKEFDIHAALEQCADLLEHFGGHRCAAGVSIRPENFELFTQRFEEIVAATITDEATTPEIIIDAELSLAHDLTPKFLNILKQFAPFGPENPIPTFVTHNLTDTGYAKKVGINHLKFSVIQLTEASDTFPAIGFQLGEYIGPMKAGKHFDICYQVEENHWHGRTETQLNTKDIHFES
ncbi:MAG: single-stranded-DNA-specific exonuclease RecJ [Bacteroidales bacterium]|nr:single-stranded-DNA-specific exonuclease RecJ [Bacteroidales bacterium]